MRRVVPLLFVALLAACSGGSPAAAPSPAGPEAGSECPDFAAQGNKVGFTTPAGTQLVGVEFGAGATGVVLAHQNLSNLCEWLPYGKRLAGRGYRILAFDFGGDGDSGPHRGDDRIDDDVAAAATHLRTTGATAVVLMGASKGGTASLAAAATLTPPPAAVVSLSGPKLFNGVSATEAVPRLTSPTLFLTAEYDSPFAEDAQELAAKFPPAVPHQILLPIGGEHGTGLLAGGQSNKVNETIDAFLKQYASA